MPQNVKPRISPQIIVCRGKYPGRFCSYGGSKGIGHKFVDLLLELIAVCRNSLLIYWGVFGRDVPEEKVSVMMKQYS
jgi:hypothetical protein